MNTQTQSKFTPGPWQAYNSEQQRIFKTWRVQSVTGRTICSMANLNEQDQHNALLCSLAPEAIEALRLLFNEVTFYTEGEPIMEKQVSLDSQYAFEAWTKARALLARLEGGVS